MAHKATNDAVGLLKAAFPGQVTTPDMGSVFQTEVSIPWSQTCWTSSAAYVRLRNAHEVAKALAIVKETGAKFALRATGHNPNAGFSSTGNTAVVLDLRGLASRELGPDGIAMVGAGNTFGEVYAWLAGHGRSAIGGRDEQVGVAGFLLGGGMGAFPNLHGFGADGIKNAEVVLADGRIVNANTKENPDLYHAIKGGGSNFGTCATVPDRWSGSYLKRVVLKQGTGIVTRFDLQTYPLIRTQYTINLYNPQDYVGIIDATIKLQEAMEKDPKIGSFTNFNAGFVAVGLLYADTPFERPVAFEPFWNLKSLITTACPTSDGTLLSLARIMRHDETDGKRRICSLTTRISQDLYEGIYKLYQGALGELPKGYVLHFTAQPVGTAAVQAGEDRGGNTLGLEKIPQCWWVFTCEWPNEDDDAPAEKAISFLEEKAEALAREKGLWLEYKCANFATGHQKVLRGYGAENLKKLQEAAAKYDPERVFQKLQNAGFLLRDNV
ncbi:Bifunctional solanapyrone synthase [Madurella mycetomatis]|uniref:Bifunctional solanapyrone synthase n=1 Tax=Madurella mycetomatis TaxID=100816 RepID=A0A175VPB3_9PEZI|nr:Bifunctional solanapyrone synthase [Madurella mycetomatis]